jgi:hypothetical protein
VNNDSVWNSWPQSDDPKHDEHDSMLVWIGGAFDPEGYDFNGINRALRCARLCVLPILRPNPKREIEAAATSPLGYRLRQDYSNRIMASRLFRPKPCRVARERSGRCIPLMHKTR